MRVWQTAENRATCWSPIVKHSVGEDIAGEEGYFCTPGDYVTIVNEDNECIAEFYKQYNKTKNNVKSQAR